MIEALEILSSDSIINIVISAGNSRDSKYEYRENYSPVDIIAVFVSES